MFGKVFICALLAAVSVTALIRFEDTVEFSPWCSCRVPVKLLLMLQEMVRASNTNGLRVVGST